MFIIEITPNYLEMQRLKLKVLDLAEENLDVHLDKINDLLVQWSYLHQKEKLRNKSEVTI